MQSAFPNMLKAWYDSVGGDAIGLTWSKEGLKVPYPFVFICYQWLIVLPSRYCWWLAIFISYRSGVEGTPTRKKKRSTYWKGLVRLEKGWWGASIRLRCQSSISKQKRLPSIGIKLYKSGQCCIFLQVSHTQYIERLRRVQLWRGNLNADVPLVLKCCCHLKLLGWVFRSTHGEREGESQFCIDGIIDRFCRLSFG